MHLHRRRVRCNIFLIRAMKAMRDAPLAGESIKRSCHETSVIICKKNGEILADIGFAAFFPVCLRNPPLHQSQLPTTG